MSNEQCAMSNGRERSRLDELIQELCPNLPAGRQVGWCAYAILCDDGSIYKGHTNDIKRRYKEHCNGQGAIYTKRHKPIRLIHIEKADSLEDAIELLTSDTAENNKSGICEETL